MQSDFFPIFVSQSVVADWFDCAEKSGKFCEAVEHIFLQLRRPRRNGMGYGNPTSQRRGLYVLISSGVYQSLQRNNVTVVRVRFSKNSNTAKRQLKNRQFMDLSRKEEHRQRALADWERIALIITDNRMSTNQFAHHIGLGRSENLYQIQRGNNCISRSLAERIHRHFPQYGMGWLLTGEKNWISPFEHNPFGL